MISVCFLVVNTILYRRRKCAIKIEVNLKTIIEVKIMTESKTKLNITIDPELKSKVQTILDKEKLSFSRAVTNYFKSMVKLDDNVDINLNELVVMEWLTYAQDGYLFKCETKLFANFEVATQWVMKHFKDEPDVDFERDDTGNIVAATTEWDGWATKEAVYLSNPSIITKVDNKNKKNNGAN